MDFSLDVYEHKGFLPISHGQNDFGPTALGHMDFSLASHGHKDFGPATVGIDLDLSLAKVDPVDMNIRVSTPRLTLLLQGLNLWL